MENKKRSNLIKGTLLAGAFLSITALSATPNSSSLFDYNALGSGAEVRSEILHSNATPFNNFEAKCGEKTKKTAEGKKAEAKCGEGKCGEGKCGEKKAEATKADAKTSEAKTATTTTTKKGKTAKKKSTEKK
jgi:uncharacterized low-complexity protein